jgi:hypothetical protein
MARFAYLAADGRGVGWFDRDEAEAAGRFWAGKVDRRVPESRFDLYRTADGRWVEGLFDLRWKRYRPGLTLSTDPEYSNAPAFAERSPERAAGWFTGNGHELPDVLCDELDARRPPAAGSTSATPAEPCHAGSGSNWESAKFEGEPPESRWARLLSGEYGADPETKSLVLAEKWAASGGDTERRDVAAREAVRWLSEELAESVRTGRLYLEAYPSAEFFGFFADHADDGLGRALGAVTRCLDDGHEFGPEVTAAVWLAESHHRWLTGRRDLRDPEEAGQAVERLARISKVLHSALRAEAPLTDASGPSAGGHHPSTRLAGTTTDAAGTGGPATSPLSAPGSKTLPDRPAPRVGSPEVPLTLDDSAAGRASAGATGTGPNAGPTPAVPEEVTAMITPQQEALHRRLIAELQESNGRLRLRLLDSTDPAEARAILAKIAGHDLSMAQHRMTLEAHGCDAGAGAGPSTGADAMEALEAFWVRLEAFLNVMLGYRVQTDPDPLSTIVAMTDRGESYSLTSPAGYAEGVIEARKRVNEWELPSAQRDLFGQASEEFDLLCERCGCPSDSGDMSRLGPLEKDDHHFRALRELVIERIPMRDRASVGRHQSPARSATGRDTTAEALDESSSRNRRGVTPARAAWVSRAGMKVLPPAPALAAGETRPPNAGIKTLRVGDDPMTGVTDRSPSVEQLRELVEALGVFAFADDHESYSIPWRQELFRLPHFVRLADALRPLRGRDLKAVGWPSKVSGWLPAALALTYKIFDIIAY